jgi:hypothetical protein
MDEQSRVITGLKLTMTGKELSDLLGERIRVHEEREAHWKHEGTRKPADQTNDQPLLHCHLCENSADEEAWRVEVLMFIREHIETDAVYMLGEADLEFGDLLPERPVWVEHDESAREGPIVA